MNETFAALKAVLSKHAARLAVQADTAVEYSLIGTKPSGFPQHKGRPMWFGSVRAGKAYVSFHLMPLYMNAPLVGSIPPQLKKRMQGKTCFNFKKPPEPEQIAALRKLTADAFDDWKNRDWL